MIIRAITRRIYKNCNVDYSIYFQNGKCLMINGCEPCQGISYWGDYYGINDLDIEEGSILGNDIINYYDLPPILRSHIERILDNRNL